MLLQQHFANAIDTQSKGIDVVISHKATIEMVNLKLIYLELSQIQK
jgi:hypothetical protein